MTGMTKTLPYGIQGEARKKLVKAVSEYRETISEYCGAPTFDYVVEDLVINKDGTVVFSAEPTEEDLQGLMEYLEALAILKKQRVRFVADFVGGTTVEVSEAQFKTALRERGLEDCTHYAGKRYGQEKEAFFCQADMFVLPSYTEAFPLTILEAMQHGLPVVATNVGGVSIAVEQGVNGLLVGGYKPIMSLAYRPDAQELADNLKMLLTDKGLRTKMGLAGLKKYQSNLTLQCFEERFVEAIYHCLPN